MHRVLGGGSGVIMKDPEKKARNKRLAAAKMLKKHAATFAGKEEYVKEHIPGIKDPAAFVAASLREAGEIP